MAAGTIKSSRTQVNEEGKSSRTQVNEEGSGWPPDAGEQHAIWRYIARATCAECHGMNLQGGQPTPEATPQDPIQK
jgi:mono/diheme cytochrome c family protein